MKNNVNCFAFKVSVIQACVIFLINYTKSKYTFANLVKIVICRTQRRVSYKSGLLHKFTLIIVNF